MKKFNLATYPIYPGMVLGSNREIDEIEWLLSNGYFQSDSRLYMKIKKNGKYYELYKNIDPFADPENEEFIIDYSDFSKILAYVKIPLERWHWYEK